jgi:hypothetical protein
MIDITISIENQDKYIAAMVKALSFESAPNLRARSASVKGARMDPNGRFVLHMANESHHLKFITALAKYLPGLANVISN